MSRPSIRRKEALVYVTLGILLMLAIVLILGGGLDAIPIGVAFGAVVGFTSYYYVASRAKDEDWPDET